MLVLNFLWNFSGDCANSSCRGFHTYLFVHLVRELCFLVAIPASLLIKCFYVLGPAMTACQNLGCRDPLQPQD